MARPKKQVALLKSKMGKEEKALREANEPKYLQRDFNVPTEFNAQEKKYWKYIVSIINDMFNCPVTDADRIVMKTLCTHAVRADSANEEIKKNPKPNYPEVVPCYDKNGEMSKKVIIVKNAWYKIAADSAKVAQACCQQLCLDVTSRAKVGHARAEAINNPLSQFSWNDESND